MRVLSSQIFLGASVFAAIAFGFLAIRSLLFLAETNVPRSAVFMPSSYAYYVWGLLLWLSPLALYVVSVALHRAFRWSLIGMIAFTIHSIYALILISLWVYVVQRNS